MIAPEVTRKVALRKAMMFNADEVLARAVMRAVQQTQSESLAAYLRGAVERDLARLGCLEITDPGEGVQRQ